MGTSTHGYFIHSKHEPFNSSYYIFFSHGNSQEYIQQPASQIYQKLVTKQGPRRPGTTSQEIPIGGCGLLKDLFKDALLNKRSNEVLIIGT